MTNNELVEKYYEEDFEKYEKYFDSSFEIAEDTKFDLLGINMEIIYNESS
jgi:hypothetical protein